MKRIVPPFFCLKSSGDSIEGWMARIVQVDEASPKNTNCDEHLYTTSKGSEIPLFGGSFEGVIVNPS